MIREQIARREFAELGLHLYRRLSKVFLRRGEFILIACMPKSGSTFLKEALKQATGFAEAELTYAYERTEQELYLPKLVDAFPKKTVTQQHVRATAANLHLMKVFHIRPVVLTRNIFDVIPSIRDYLLLEGAEQFPSLYATEHFAAMNEADQYEFLIRYALPWYFQFYVSWSDASISGQTDALWISYEELSADWTIGISKILDHYGLSRSQAHINDAIEKTRTKGSLQLRFNKGVSGRGKQLLSDDHKQLIRKMADFYPWIDFTPLGLTSTGFVTKPIGS